MQTSSALPLLKARLGISTTIRDSYLEAILKSIIKELEDEKGLTLDESNFNHLMFVVDYSSWRYENKGSDGGMPRHLQFRIHNLMISNKSLIVNIILNVDSLPISPVLNTVYILEDGTMQMYINDVWISVNMANGVWVVV